MKRRYLIITCIIAFIIPISSTMFNNVEKKEIFECKIDTENVNCIELIYFTDSICGTFYGVEFRANGERVYYKSNIDSLKIEGNKISFKLNDYIFNSTKFDDKEVLLEKYRDTTNLPDILRFTQNFTGTKKSDTLILKRISILNDSSFDEFVFLKKKDDKKKRSSK